MSAKRRGLFWLLGTEKTGHEAGLLFCLCCAAPLAPSRLYGFRDLARAQALCAYLDMFDFAVLVDLDRLYIGVPFAPRVAVGVRDVVAAHLALAADSTFS